jgi:hypothetical protein
VAEQVQGPPTIPAKLPAAAVLAATTDLSSPVYAKSEITRELRKGKPSVFNGALIYELQPAADAKGQLHGVSWQPVTQNINERFHYLLEVSADCDALGAGLPNLLIDFRRYFTLPTREIYRQCELGPQGASRRCRLLTPYREHLQNRASYYFQRVALP